MMWLWLCVLAFAVSPAAGVMGGAPAAPPEPDAAVVFTQKYGLSGRLEGMKDDRRGYYIFSGIRYAEPPIGPRRFQRPVRRYLSGELTAKSNCAPCPQLDPRGTGVMIGHEDCLCLNIFSPKMPGEEEGSPVILFIHGGNYRTGSAAPYGGQLFAQKDTIVVSVQYRLGSLGFLSTGQRDASGNTGLFDLRAAIEWINDYIEFFGGDKSRLVVMGQGSGGSAASLLALSPEGRSFTGVAALSGAPLSPGAIRDDPNRHAEALAEKTGCPKAPAERLLLCLRKIPAEKIVQADKEISTDMIDTKAFLDEIAGRGGSGARVEGLDDKRGLPPVVYEEPSKSLKMKQQQCPMLTGVVSAETSKAVFGKYGKFLTEKMNAVKDFIKKDLIGGLRNTVQDIQNVLPDARELLPLPDYYQAIFDSSLNVVDGLSEIAEATGDALFNFPAYQSVREWSTGSPAFLYSFEHVGNLSKGSHFLPGLAITQGPDNTIEGSDKRIKGPAHGDELAYLFEPLDDEGKSVGGQISEMDARVRDSFVDLIAKFAHRKPENKNMKNVTNIFGFLPFSSDSEQYIKITDKITLDKNFRFCQMGLWGNMADRITGAICKNVLGNILNLPKLLNPLDKLTLTKPTIPGLPTLLNQGNRNQNRPTEKPMIFSNPFGF
ncbi:pyrethroid hydrolase Ces2e [Melitaea cinxia]|uniref:pyrethroid hydrolase Ces2e n=1 Tax=Melitaea cinxia TaxID=113334 RepID=UPI001E272525|nr:pyrethroid hydrolase Ces2e [Melitaea cinxia]